VIRVSNGMNLFDDKCLILVDCLRRLGFEAEIDLSLPDRWSSAEPRREDLWIGYWDNVPLRSLPPRYIAMQTEPMRVAGAWWTEQEDWIPMLRGAVDVWDYQESNESIIEGLGRPFHHVPCGFSPLHDTWYRAAAADIAEPDIDVLFVGGMLPRREHAIEQLRACGLRVEVVSYGHVVVGADLHRLLARSRLLLGIHRYEEPEAHMVDLFRFDIALANAVPVLHERLIDPSPFESEFLDRVPFYDLDDVVDAVMARLADPDGTRADAQRTMQWFRQDCLIDRFIPVESLRQALQQL